MCGFTNQRISLTLLDDNKNSIVIDNTISLVDRLCYYYSQKNIHRIVLLIDNTISLVNILCHTNSIVDRLC